MLGLCLMLLYCSPHGLRSIYDSRKSRCAIYIRLVRSAHQVACACSFTAEPGGRLAKSSFPVCVYCSTKSFKEDKWATSLLRPHPTPQLVTRRDLIPSEPKGFNMRRKTSAPNSSPDERCFVGSLI
jgi:hypothetical protein